MLLQCLSTRCISPRPKLDSLLTPFGRTYHEEDRRQQVIQMKLWNLGIFLLLVIQELAVLQIQHVGKWENQLMSSFTCTCFERNESEIFKEKNTSNIKSQKDAERFQFAIALSNSVIEIFINNRLNEVKLNELNVN